MYEKRPTLKVTKTPFSTLILKTWNWKTEPNFKADYRGGSKLLWDIVLINVEDIVYE